MLSKLGAKVWFAFTIVVEQGDWIAIVNSVVVFVSHPDDDSAQAVRGPANASQFMLTATIAPDRSLVRISFPLMVEIGLATDYKSSPYTCSRAYGYTGP
jgi:hypothetical protein